MLREEAAKAQGTQRFSAEESGKSWDFGTENKVKKYRCLASPSLCRIPHSGNDVFGELQTRLGGDRVGGKEGSRYSTSPTAHLQGSTVLLEALQGCKMQVAAPSAASAGVSWGQV